MTDDTEEEDQTGSRNRPSDATHLGESVPPDANNLPPTKTPTIPPRPNLRWVSLFLEVKRVFALARGYCRDSTGYPTLAPWSQNLQQSRQLRGEVPRDKYVNVNALTDMRTG